MSTTMANIIPRFALLQSFLLATQVLGQSNTNSPSSTGAETSSPPTSSATQKPKPAPSHKQVDEPKIGLAVVGTLFVLNVLVFLYIYIRWWRRRPRKLKNKGPEISGPDLEARGAHKPRFAVKSTQIAGSNALPALPQSPRPEHNRFSIPRRDPASGPHIQHGTDNDISPVTLADHVREQSIRTQSPLITQSPVMSQSPTLTQRSYSPPPVPAKSRTRQAAVDEELRRIEEEEAQMLEYMRARREELYRGRSGNRYD